MSDSLVHQIVETALAIAASALTPLLIALVFKLLQKVHLDVAGQQQQKVAYWVQQAIFEAEEWAAKRIAAKIPVASTEKLDRALESVLTKVPSVTPTEARQLIHTELPKVRAATSNFLNAVSTAAKS